MNSILRITGPILSDDSIDRYEDIEYEPVVGTSLTVLEWILDYTSKLKIFLHIPAKAF